MKLTPLAENTVAQNSGYTHEVILTPANFAEAAFSEDAGTNDTDLTYTLYTTAVGDRVIDAAFHLVTPFEDQSDAAYNDTKVSLGDEDDPDGFLTATQINVNGTEVYVKHGDGALIPHTYTAAKDITLLVESMTAKKLANLDKGHLVIQIEIDHPDERGLKGSGGIFS